MAVLSSRAHENERRRREKNKLLSPQSPHGFSALPLLLARPTKTAMLRRLIDVKLNFFHLSVLWNYYAYTYSFFDNISHTVCEKTAIHSLVCLLRSLLLTRPFQILLGNFLATFRILSNFFVREQLLATFRKTSTFLVTFGQF